MIQWRFELTDTSRACKNEGKPYISPEFLTVFSERQQTTH